MKRFLAAFVCSAIAVFVIISMNEACLHNDLDFFPIVFDALIVTVIYMIVDAKFRKKSEQIEALERRVKALELVAVIEEPETTTDGGGSCEC